MNTVKDLANELKIAALRKNKSESEIRDLEKQAMTQAFDLANGLHPNWIKECNIRPLSEHDFTFKVQSGQIRRNAITNTFDMFEGCYNRLHVTKERDEFVTLHRNMGYYIHALAQFALEGIGAVKIPVFEWKCNLNL